MQFDYIVVGQGLCGSFLSYYLQQAGKSVLVIDEWKPFTASKVASGVINPVTGRRIVRTWMIETLMPFAVDAYQQMGVKMNTPLIRQCNILDFHSTPQMHLAFMERMPEETTYLKLPDDAEAWRTYFNYPFGIGETNPCWLIDLHMMMQQWRKQLVHLDESAFVMDELQLKDDHIQYQNITAEKIFFCDGVNGFDNPYFSLLPYARNKGQAIIAAIPGLPRTNIFKQGINIVPWQEDLFWIGSTYEWDYTDPNPSPAFREKVEQQLQQWVKLPYTIVDHWASERPANLERRPFVGLHPIHQQVGILNGMGTKGCSLAPYFAHQLTEHLVNGTELHPHADVQRFRKILSR